MAKKSIVEVTMSTIKESQRLYPARSVDALLEREREAAIERENTIKDLIAEQDNTFDDLCQALGDVVNMQDLEEHVYTSNDMYERVNELTHVLQKAYRALLGT